VAVWLALAVVFGVGAVAAYGRYRGAVEHRRAVDASLREYARFTARAAADEWVHAAADTAARAPLRAAALGARALRRVALVPPAFARLEDIRASDLRTERADTLLALTVADAAGRVLFRSARQFFSAVADTASAGAGPARVTVRAALAPALVERVRRDHEHPTSVLLWAVVIPATIMGLVSVAALLVWRERQLARAREDFVASVSHELRTPLAQIRAVAETLRLGRARSDAERERWLGVIDREARRLGDLVENVVLFSHLERAGFRVHPEKVDLSALVADVVASYEPFAEARGARLAAAVVPGAWVTADPHAVRQVLVNLLDNALKYGPAGQTVAVALAADAAAARLSVADEGPGIPAGDRARIWAPFTRLARGNGQGGAGLGLAVVRTLVQQHGGDVRVEDAEPQGARFVVTLPA
jgi:signal transduction histidine kinase